MHRKRCSDTGILRLDRSEGNNMSRDDQDDPAAKGETEKPCILCLPPKSAVSKLQAPVAADR